MAQQNTHVQYKTGQARDSMSFFLLLNTKEDILKNDWN